MSIATIYRVSVDIPETVYSNFRQTADYARMAIEATSGSVRSGQNVFPTVAEWADFRTLQEAQACQQKLLNMTYRLAAKLLQENGAPLEVS